MKDTAGKSTESLAELLDLYPTLCELTGVEAPEFAEGKSLVPILRDPTAKVHEMAVSQYYRRPAADEEYMGYAMRTDKYRYVEWRDFKTGEMKAQELYEHTKPALSSLGVRETKNLAPDAKPELLEELSTMLRTTHPPLSLIHI